MRRRTRCSPPAGSARGSQPGPGQGTKGSTATHAATGTVITIRFQGDDETEKFLLGSREIVGTTGLQVYSPESALGSAILGAAPGATVTYQAPNGRDITVHVVAVEPFVP